MERRPIYLVLTTYFPTPSSWRCAYVYDQVQAIRRARPNWRIVVLNLDSPKDYVYEGVTVWGGFHRIAFSGSAFFPRHYYTCNGRSLVACLSEHGVDCADIRVIHAHLPTNAALTLTVRKAFPNAVILAQHHHVWYFAANGLFRTFKASIGYRFQRWAAEAADAHISISNAVTETLLNFPKATHYRDWPPMCAAMKTLRLLRPARPKSVYLLHNGVDTRLFSPPAAKKPCETFTIGCVANFISLKGHLILLKALAALGEQARAWRLRLIGSGPTQEACRRFIAGGGKMCRLL